MSRTLNQHQNDVHKHISCRFCLALFMKIEGKEECTLACYPVIFLNIHSLTNYKHHISVKIENLLLNFLNNIILLLERPLPLCITDTEE